MNTNSRGNLLEKPTYADNDIATLFFDQRLAILSRILAIVHRPALLKSAEHSIGMKLKDDADCELAIFTEAIKVPIQERAAFLDFACHGDETLRGKVEALLKAHDRVGNFLEEPPTGDPLIDAN